ncbi:pecanex-like protein 2 isoform X2 [Ornithorhynchus anatinus]|uniref:Pecanex-like protein n=1 Tax=Ornithorhynchus anatinus TaxID=9258 RepID=F6QX22_ORNAN|nr:pecanex-like protein 2 isoform X2 [Ornithorhynchus anatinus]
MVSQGLQLLRQGVWAALTGGWYHDPDHSKFTNSCHLYLWLFLLLLPLALHLAFPPNAATALVYCSSVTVVFATMKLVSYRLHLMFDEGEAEQRGGPSQDRAQKDSRKPRSGATLPAESPSNKRLARRQREGARWDSCTPPLRCSSRGHSLNSHSWSGSGPSERQEPEAAEDPLGARSVPSSACSAGPVGGREPGPRATPPGPPPGITGCAERPATATPPATAEPRSPAHGGSDPVVPAPGEKGPGAEGDDPQSLLADGGERREPRGDCGHEGSRSPSPLAGASGDLDDSEGEVAVTLVDNSVPGDPLCPHEPVRIVVTMSGGPSSGAGTAGGHEPGRDDSQSDLEPTGATPSAGRPLRIPLIKFQLPDRGDVPQRSGPGDEAPDSAPEGGGGGADHAPFLDPDDEAGPDTPAPRRARGQRQARGLSVDSGTDLASSHESAEVTSDTERALPTSKSDLEAKEGQPPSESNFLEFVSLLESISSSKGAVGVPSGLPVGVPTDIPTGVPNGAVTEPPQESRLRERSVDRSALPRVGEEHSSAHCGGGGGPLEKKEEILERGKPRDRPPKPGKSDVRSQDRPSALPSQGSRQRQIVYRVKSQPDGSLLQVISGPDASVQDEDSVGAVHVFIGEHGEIRSCYLKAGTQKEGPPRPQGPSSDRVCSVQETLFSSPSSTPSASLEPPSGDPAASALQQQLLLLVARRTQSDRPRPCQDPEDYSCSSSQRKFSREQFYKLIIFPGKWIKVWHDRLTLLALLDRTEDVKENVLATVLVLLVSLLGFVTLSRGFCKDLWALQFCLVMASCQYSLLKSVQPDPASPVHGYNQIITYSRPAYFCVLCALILLLDAGSTSRPPPSVVVFGVRLFSPGGLRLARDALIVFLYCFPAISLLGLFPQIDTFCTYLLEQVDMLVFGGSAVTGGLAAVYGVARSLLTAVGLNAFCFSAVKEPWNPQHVPALFSTFCGLLVALSYHLSRHSSDPTVLLSLFQGKSCPRLLCPAWAESPSDPLPEKMRESVKEILKSDLIMCAAMMVLAFAVSASTVFLALRPFLSTALFALAGAVGFTTHYLLPELRKHHPWMWLAHPLLRSHEHRQRHVSEPARLMWFERLYVWLQYLEKLVLYPAVALHGLTVDAFAMSVRRVPATRCEVFLLTVAGMKLLRTAFCNPVHQFLALGFTVLFFRFDCRGASESFLLNFLVVSILFGKLDDLLHKLRFVLAYVAPWQIAWGSSFHVFAQLFAIPHSAVLFLQTLGTAALSAPLSPFLGSVIFLASYVRPVRFWEKDYRTRHLDNSTTRLATQIEKDPGADQDNNRNSVFYEHLTRSLQESLCGDLALGRWGSFSAGDCFILASDYLNAFVHLVETGNGLVTFQLRGLEFRGTYCQQREVEAITEGDEADQGCCCCRPGHLPHLLSCNAAFSLRWLSWEVARTQYVLRGYSVSDSSAATMLQVFDLRRILVRFYVQSMIYFVVSSPKLALWIHDESLLKPLQPYAKWHHIERDPALFSLHVDDDFVPCLQGITRASFCTAYLQWIQFCAQKRQERLDSDEDSPLVTLCFALCIMGRRTLGVAAHNMAVSLDSFLFGLHTLFKGDFRVAVRDEWVFADMDLLHRVVAPAVRMSLKLHQDQFACPDEYEDPAVLFEAMGAFESTVVVCHEGDPGWRRAVLAGREELLTLRRVVDEGADDYKVIRLRRAYLTFKVIKVNRECVRGLWAGQQQELIFLRNRNPERGSIQNHRQVLRNLINSSCDQPLGYPVYVSPLITSFLGSHDQLGRVWGGPAGLSRLGAWLRVRWRRMQKDCHAGHRGSGHIEEGDGSRGGGARGTSGSSEYSSGSTSRHGSAEQPRKASSPWQAAARDGPRHAGRKKGRSRPVQAGPGQRPAPPGLSGPAPGGQQSVLQTSTSAQEMARRPSGSRQSWCSSAASLQSQPAAPGAPLPPAAPGPARGRAGGPPASSLGSSSTSSTLSLLFGKRSLSSVLVISGLSAADGGNTSDTLSSSSVNIAAGPSARAAAQQLSDVTDGSEPARPAARVPGAGPAAGGQGGLCRRASQEDVELDDTGSLPSLSEEQ